MFRKWLESNDINSFDFSTPLFPKANDREFWDSKYDQSIIDDAEQYLGYDWPVAKATDFLEFKLSGNRSVHEKPYFDRRHAIVHLFAAEVLEHKGRFIPDIMNGIFAICEETYWGLSAHFCHFFSVNELQNIPTPENKYIDLFAAETGSILSMIHYMLYDELNEYCHEILRYIEIEIEERMIKPYLEFNWWWMGYTQDVNNWNPWIISNLLTVFLLMDKDEERKKKAIKKMFVEINRIYDRLPDDGGCDEGAGYWFVSGGTIFEFVDMLYVATNGKLDLYYEQKLRDILRFAYNMYIGDGKFVNFADAPCKSPDGPLLIFLIGKRLKDEKMMKFAGTYAKLNFPMQYKIKRILYSMIYKKEIFSQEEFINQDEVVYDKLHVSVMRNQDWLCAMKGGDNDEGHNHNDIGSFILCDNCEYVLCDPGVGAYTRQTFGPERYTIWTMRSDWHNLPVVNDTVQKQGKVYAADKFLFSTHKTNVSFKNAYPESAGLKNLERFVELNEDGLDIADEFEFINDKNKISEHFITPLDVAVTDKGAVVGNKYVICSNVPCSVSTESVSFENDVKLNDSWKQNHMNRIIFKFECNEKALIKFELRRI